MPQEESNRADTSGVIAFLVLSQFSSFYHGTCHGLFSCHLSCLFCFISIETFNYLYLKLNNTYCISPKVMFSAALPCLSYPILIAAVIELES